MKIETTLYINKTILDKITKTSKTLGKSRTETIIILMKKIMDCDKMKALINSSIKYQKNDDHNNWHRFHLSLLDVDYEYFLDLRKLMKMSVSNILAYAVNKFLHTLNKQNFTDNYTFSNYILVKNSVDGIIFWQLFWGIPRKIEEFLKYSKL